MIMLFTNLLIINTILILLMFVCQVTSIKCYQCHTNDNRLCLESGLKDCPDDQAYDMCMTTIKRMPEDGLHIRKACALGPCHFRDDHLKMLLSFDETCKDKNVDCIHCCNKDGCNTDGVSMISAHNLLITSMISLIIVLSLISLNF